MVAPLFPGDATSGILTELAVEFFELHPFRTPVVAPNHCIIYWVCNTWDTPTDRPEAMWVIL